jgi:hypothetical protein
MDFGADVGEKRVDRRSKHVLLPMVDDQALDRRAATFFHGEMRGA